MKTVLIEEPFKIGLTDTEKPIPKEGEALLKVLYCGICGADVASYTGNQPFTTYPRIPGHEFSAQIVSLQILILTAGNATPAREDMLTAVPTTRPWVFSVTVPSGNI